MKVGITVRSRMQCYQCTLQLNIVEFAGRGSLEKKREVVCCKEGKKPGEVVESKGKKLGQ